MGGTLTPYLYFYYFLSLFFNKSTCGKIYLVKTIDSQSNRTQNIEESGTDYSHGEPHFPGAKKVAEGDNVSLKCESPNKFVNCKFEDPTGKVHSIGTKRTPRRYGDNKRIDCLCQRENYDATKVCGVFIRNAKKEDTGVWSCITEFNKDGSIVAHTVPKYLQVGDDLNKGLNKPTKKSTSIHKKTTIIPRRTTIIPRRTTIISGRTTIIPRGTTIIQRRTTIIPRRTPFITRRTTSIPRTTQRSVQVLPTKRRSPVTQVSSNCDCGRSAVNALEQQISQGESNKVIILKSESTEGNETLSGEISGGYYAEPKQYPWTVRLVGGCPGTVCGGALVSPRTVLTAHHCTVPIGATSTCDHSDGRRIAVLGTNIINIYELFNNPAKYYTIPVVDVRAPPNAKLRYGNFASHDFAMLILKYPAKYDEFVRPICLPNLNANYGNRFAKAAGWGRTEAPSGSQHQSPRLKAVQLKVNPKMFRHRLMFGTFLVKEQNVYQDPCSGDSGGSLMYQKETTGRFVLIGTVFGQGFNCKTGGVGRFEGTTDGIWNKVSAHMQWIERNMNQLGELVCKQ